MPLLSTFESPYRKTATLAGYDVTEFYSIVKKYGKEYGTKEAIYKAFKELRERYPGEDFSPIYNYITEKYNENPEQYAEAAEAARLFRVTEGRNASKAAAQKIAQEQAAAYAAAMAKEQAQAVELPEGLDASELIAIEEAAKAVNLDALSIEAQAQAAQAVEAYAEGRATPQQVEAAIDTAAAVEQEKTRNALLNVGLPLTLAVGLFIFFFKGKKK